MDQQDIFLQILSTCERDVSEMLRDEWEGKKHNNVNKPVFERAVTAMVSFLRTLSTTKSNNESEHSESVENDTLNEEAETRAKSEEPTEGHSGDSVNGNEEPGDKPNGAATVNTKKVAEEQPCEKKKKKICKDHRKRICKKQKEGCPFDHPNWCQRAMKFGLKKYHSKGCDTSRCNHFHPYFCKSSLTTKTCFNQKCKNVHLKGTKRKPDQSKAGSKSNKKTSPNKPNAPSQLSGIPPAHQGFTFYQPSYAQVAQPSNPSFSRADFLHMKSLFQGFMNFAQSNLVIS